MGETTERKTSQPPAQLPERQTKKISDEEFLNSLPIEERLGIEFAPYLRDIVNNAVMNKRPIVFDLKVLDDVKAAMMNIYYDSLNEATLSILNKVIMEAWKTEYPEWMRESSGTGFPRVIYVNGPRMKEPTFDKVGMVFSVESIVRELNERVVAQELLYRCPSCGNEYRVKRGDDPPMCMSAPCSRTKRKTFLIGPVSTTQEVTFYVRLENGTMLRCVAQKERIYDSNRGIWFVRPGVECEVTGILRTSMKKNGEIEYYLEVVGARSTSFQEIQENEADHIRTVDELRECFPHVVGEDETLILSTLAIASRYNADRNWWIMGVMLQGLSSSGKSYIMNAVLEPWKALARVKELSRFTGAYLERMAKVLKRENVDNLILAVPELFEAPQQLHILLSEGKLTLGIVDKETGEPIEFEIEGQPLLFVTTTAVEVREDLMNRVIQMRIREDEEQTRRIAEFEARLALDMEGTIMRRKAYGMAKLISHIQGLKTYKVFVPYVPQLVQRFCQIFPAPVTLRRDIKKAITIIMASALFFQRDRPKKVNGNGEEILIATEEDFDVLLRILPQLKTTMIRLSPAEKAIIEVLKNGNDSGLVLTKRQIATELAQRYKIYYSERHIHNFLMKLVDMGIIYVDDTTRPYRYGIARMPTDLTLDDLREEVAATVRKYLENGALPDVRQSDNP
ncbi:MAG: hypothetical protein QXP81_10410 [Nitrososphaerota archaeon]